MKANSRINIFDTVFAVLFLASAVIVTLGTYGALRGGIETVLPANIGSDLYAVCLALMVVLPSVWLTFRGRGSVMRMQTGH